MISSERRPYILRYTLTNRAIAVLLSLILLLGSASGLVTDIEPENTYNEIIDSDNIADNNDTSDNPPINSPVDNNSDNNDSDTSDTIKSQDFESTEPEKQNNPEFQDNLNCECEPVNENACKSDSCIFLDDGENQIDENEADDKIIDNDSDDSQAFQQDIASFSSGTFNVTANRNNTGGRILINGFDPFSYGWAIPYTGHVKIEAISNLGWSLVGWEITGGLHNNTGASSLIFDDTILDNIVVNVTFGQPSGIITYGVLKGDGILTRPDGFINESPPFVSSTQVAGDFGITFEANATGSYLIENWYVNGTSVDPDDETFEKYTSNNRGDGDTLIQVGFVEGYNVKFNVFPTSISTNPINASYLVPPGSKTRILSNNTGAPEGAVITFTAPEAPSEFNLFAYEWNVYDGDYVEGKVPISSVTKPPSDRSFVYTGIDKDITVTVTLVRGYEVFYQTVVDGGTVAAKAANGVVVLPGDLVKSGTSVTFTATNNSGFNVFEYKWLVGENSASPAPPSPLPPPDANTFEYTPSSLANTINVSVELVQGHYVSFDDTEISATRNSQDVDPDILHPRNSIITFKAENPLGKDVFSYIWYVASGSGAPIQVQSGKANTFTLPSPGLTDDIIVTVTLDEGITVSYSITGAVAAGGLTAETLDSSFAHINYIDSGDVLEGDTTIRFTATSPVGAFRVYEWRINGNTPQPGELSSDGTILTLQNINSSVNVTVEFEEITITLSDDEVTIITETGILDITFELKGSRSGVFTSANSVVFNVIGDALPTGALGTLTVTQPGASIIRIQSVSLTDAANTIDRDPPKSPFKVSVTLEGATTDLLIDVDIPYMRISPATVALDNSTLSIEMTLETNARGITSIPSLTPFPEYPSLPLPGVVYYSVEEVSAIEFKVTIRAIRPLSGAATTINAPATVIQNGTMSRTFALNVYLTPPPRIDTITPTSDTLSLFENVRVRGSNNTPGISPPYSSEPIIAEFIVEGEFFDEGNELQVESSIVIQALSTLPDWIVPGAVSTVVDTDKKVLVEVPIEIKSHEASVDGANRFDNFVITTTLANSLGISGTLPVSQVGPIRILDPNTLSLLHENTIYITNDNLSDLIKVTGSLEISDDSNLILSSVSDNIWLEYTNNIDEDTVSIKALRPQPPLEYIKDDFYVTLTRDGFSATLLIKVDITAVDDPDVVWPSGMTATYMDLLNDIIVHDFEPDDEILDLPINPGDLGVGYGYASFTQGAVTVRVPGTFRWDWDALAPFDETDATVGNAGSTPNMHPIVFTPKDLTSFAVIRGTAGVTVAKADPVMTWQSTFTATFGQMLSEVDTSSSTALFNSNPVPGTFQWIDSTNATIGATTPVGDVLDSPHDYNLFFIPTNTNFNIAGPYTASVTVGKATPSAPDTGPVSASTETAVSISLIAISYAEYGVSSSLSTIPTIWQDSTEFLNLTPGTQYFFFYRLKERDNYYASLPSPGTGIFTLQADLDGVPVITAGADGMVYLGELSVDLSDLYVNPPGGADGRIIFENLDEQFISYRWYRRDPVTTTIVFTGETSNIFIPQAADIGQDIFFTVETDITKNTVQSQFVRILKRTPVLENLNPASINLTAVTFTGTAQSVPTPTQATGVTGLGVISVEYFINNTWVATAPINAGTYQVRAVIDDTGTNYTNAAIPIGNFTINKATPTNAHIIVTLPGVTPGTIGWSDWVGSSKAGLVVPSATGSAIGIVNSGITVEYSLNNGAFTSVPSAFPGDVIIRVVIAGTDNLNTVTLSDSAWVFTIQGEPINPVDFESEIYEIVSGVPTNKKNFDISIGYNEDYDGITRRIIVNDPIGDGTTPGTVYYRLNPSDDWSASSPTFDFRNVTSQTLYFRVIREESQYNPYYGEVTVTILQKQLTWGASGTVENKVYNRSVAANIITNPALEGIIGTDNVFVVPGTAVFDDWDVGTDKPVTATGTWAIGGTAADNYSAPSGFPSFNTANISAKALTISGVLATNRDYNASELVVLTGGSLNGVETGDTVSFTLGDGTMANSNAGTGKAVTTAIILIGGGNYTLTQPTGITVVIAPKELAISGVFATNRNYNGLYTVGLVGGLLSGVEAVDFDYVGFTLGSGTIASADAGSGKAVTTAITLIGTKAANYTLTQPSGITVTIMQVPLTPSILFIGVTGKVFDNTPTIIGVQPTISLTGAVNSENPTATAVSFAFFDEHVELNKRITATGISLTGSWGVNYTVPTTFTQVSGVNITQRQITGSVNISANTPTIIDGTILTADISSIIGVPSGTGATSGSAVTPLSYQWYNGTTPIGTDSDTLTINYSDGIGIDSVITVKVSGLGNYTGDISATPVIVGRTPIYGTISISSSSTPPTLGSSLTLVTSGILPSSADYDIIWLRDGVAIPDEASPTYVINQEDLGKTISVNVVAKGDYTGSLSAFVSVPAIAPLAPQNFIAVPGDTFVSLSWAAPAFDGGNPITGYEVSFDNGITWANIGLVTSYTVQGLVNGTAYTFNIRAVNSAGTGAEATASATPVALPVVLSITPTPGTLSAFANVPIEGLTFDAEFNISGLNLTDQIETGNVFSISSFPAWVSASGFSVEFVDSENAIIKVTITVSPNTSTARNGNIVIGNTLTSTVNGTLAISQAGGVTPVTSYNVTIINVQSGISVPLGQSDSVRTYNPGESVSLAAGSSDGYIFNNWSSGSPGVIIDNADNIEASFMMPANDVIIYANWTEISPVISNPQTPPAEPLANDPNVPPPEPPPTDTSGSGGSQQPGNTNNPGSNTPSLPPTNTGSDSSTLPDTAGVTKAPSMVSGFGSWIINNLWWIVMYLGALILFGVLWYIHIRKHRKRKIITALPPDG